VFIHGGIHAGPNAVLAFAREGYRKRDINVRELMDSLSYSGFLALARKNWREGAHEVARSFSKKLFVKSLQELIPEVRAEHLVPAAAGIRAQALHVDGKLVDDFLLVPSKNGRALHVLNAPSPAATASLEIGDYVGNKVREHLK
jgi:(S)-2-hydroxyglutarate dehydrogenase